MKSKDSVPDKNQGKNSQTFFEISHSNVNIIILSLTFLSLVLVQIVIAVYQNTIVPIPTWVNVVNALPFFFTIIMLLYLFMFLEHGYFWKILTLGLVLVTLFSLIINFVFLFPRSYTLYQFSCGLNNLNQPLISLWLNNFGKGIAINDVRILVSENNYSIFNEGININGNVQFTLQPNENFKTSFAIKPPRNANSIVSITNNIGCDKFNCYILGKTPANNECAYKCQQDSCALLKQN